jgi:hypothetical protein
VNTLLNLNLEDEMLTFELTEDSSQIEIHGDSGGLMALAQMLTTLATKSSPDHIHIMTDDWGGSGLTSVKQGFDNEIVHHVKVFFWTKGP